jgi:hypothetical protein
MKRSYTLPTAPDQPHPLVLAAPSAATAAWLWSRSDMLQQTWDVVQAAADLPGVVTTPHPGGLCLTLDDGAALGRLRWDGRIYLMFGPEVRNRLVAEEMARLDPDQPDADRVVFDLRSGADVDRAAWLLRLAYLYADSIVEARAHR